MWFHGLEQPIAVVSWRGTLYSRGLLVWKDPEPWLHDLERPIGTASCFGMGWGGKNIGQGRKGEIGEETDDGAEHRTTSHSG